MKSYAWIIIAILCASAVHAAAGHITLLTVSDEATGMGGTADLYLTVKPGQGSVYIDSFPLTRIDTQGSVRYANQIACDLLQEDCSRYDFFYTIRANSAIVGGPSAGAAMAVLTVAVLDGQSINQHIAMTGTINSGGIVGPVAGIGAKLNGAKAAGMTEVLIPSLTQPEDVNSNLNNATVNESNETITRPVKQVPLTEGKDTTLSDNDITVVRVSTVEAALLIFTGKNYSTALRPLVTPDEYSQRMTTIADEICGRMNVLEQNLTVHNIPYNDSNNYTARIAALPSDHQYSRASLCFSKNIELSYVLLANQSSDVLNRTYRSLRVQAAQLDTSTSDTPIMTIGDLETYAIVKERIIEAQKLLDKPNAKDPRNLAYAQERLISALSWSRFFGMPGKHVELNNEYLQRACLSKLAEADERINYVRLYAPTIVGDAEEMLNQAQSYSGDEPILCIFTASKAKAQANVLSSAISIGQQSVDAALQQKLDADTLVLEKQQQKDFFPILGTSYTQYAEDLRATSPYTAMIFSEYSLELSNIDIYFPKKPSFRLPPGISDSALLFGLGAIFGIGVATIIYGWRLSKMKQKGKVVKKRK